jgi:DNA helicase-2/ATP-dependent DNA helicase PcrA
MPPPLSLDLDSALNAEQRSAVETLHGPLLILAGAGTGKTRVITWRIAHLLATRAARPDEILAVTFTNKAARELRERAASLVGAEAESVHISTFHSACARWLRRWGRPAGLGPSFSILDSDDQLALVRLVAEELHLPADATAARSYVDRIDAAHQSALRVDQVHEQAVGHHAEAFATLFERYEHAMTRIQACDFGSLIARVVHLLEDHPDLRARFHERYRWLMVDEFQDTDPAQYQLLRRLASADANVAVVGDDDQSIYGWRGATVENVARFRSEFDARVIALVQNYRSTRTILEAAHDVVARLPNRMEKKLRTDRVDTNSIIVHVAVDDREEAEWIARTLAQLRGSTGTPWSEHAVFYRANAQSRVVEERLRAHGIPYKISGGTSFFDRREVRDVLAWLRVAVNPSDDVAFRRIVNTPPRGVGKTTLQQLDTARRDGRATTLRDALARRDRILARMTARTRDGLARLDETLEMLERLARNAPVPDVVEAVLTDTGYESWLAEQKDDDTEERVRHLSDLRVSAREFCAEHPEAGLAEFLDSISLRAVTAEETDAGAVQLMTVHASKGLEFDTVFVTGLEDRQFPSLRRGATMESDEIEEERRLYYVAVTRARTRLYLTASMRRRLFGQTRPCDPSPFLLETRRELITMSPESARTDVDWRRSSPERVRAAGAEAESARPGAWTSSNRGASHGATADAWDQRTGWDEPVWDDAPPVPEQGIIFDDSHYPEAKDQAARAWVGRRAHHKTFGVGQIVGADPSGSRVRLTIRFPDVGTKNVVSNYVELLDD